MTEDTSGYSLTLCLACFEPKPVDKFIDEAYRYGYQCVAVPLNDPSEDDSRCLDCVDPTSQSMRHGGGQISSDVFSHVYGIVSPDLFSEDSFRRASAKPTTAPISSSSASSSSASTSISTISQMARIDESTAFSAKLCSLEMCLSFQIKFAGHLGIRCVILPPLPTNDDDLLVRYCSCVGRVMSECSALLSALVPVPCSKEGWKALNTCQQLLSVDSGVVYGLLLKDTRLWDGRSGDSESVLDPEDWVSVGITNVIIDSGRMFVPNDQGSPVLPRMYARLIGELLRWSDLSVIVDAVLDPIPLLSDFVCGKRTNEYPSSEDVSSSTAVIVDSERMDDSSLLVGFNDDDDQTKRKQNQTKGKIPVFDAERATLIAQYLCHLKLKLDDSRDSELSDAEKYFVDTLQNPLQPLRDNLEYSTYETFETDPVKYVSYENAVFKAIEHKRRNYWSLLKSDECKPMCVMVLGAGRGPLVDACLRAIQRSNQQPYHLRGRKEDEGQAEVIEDDDSKKRLEFVVFVVEKNPFAVVTLQTKLRMRWMDECKALGNVRLIEVISGDMRNVGSLSYKADVIVSELLGSFGDNELSPECLDGATSLLSEQDELSLSVRKYGLPISVPSKYTAWIQPVHCPGVWASVNDGKQPMDLSSLAAATGWSSSKVDLYEVPYVVQLVHYSELSDIQECWSFRHPLKPSEMLAMNSHNSRYVKCEFKADRIIEPTLLHGFAGYFDTELFGDEMLSIKPDESFSEGMFSWFPIWFPIKQPILVNKGDLVTLHLWRKCSATDVWFEWVVSSPSVSAIHNPNGRSYKVGL